MADTPANKNVPASIIDRRKPGRAKSVKADVAPVVVPALHAEPVVHAVEPAFDPAAPSIPLEASISAAALDVPAVPEAPVIEKADADVEAALPPVIAEAPALEAAPAAPTPAEAAPTSASIADVTSAPVSTKGYAFMATVAPEFTKPATERFQAMFGEANDRAKAAVERSAKLAEELTELTKGNVEALVASGRVAAKGAESLTQEAAEYSKKSFESATGALRSFAAAKSPVELIQLQNDFAKTSFDAAIAEASKLSETWVKLAGDIFQPLSSRFAVAAEKIKATSL
jgi:phasin family protein